MKLYFVYMSRESLCLKEHRDEEKGQKEKWLIYSWDDAEAYSASTFCDFRITQSFNNQNCLQIIYTYLPE